MLEDEKLRSDVNAIQHSMANFRYGISRHEYSKLYRYLIEETDIDLELNWDTKVVMPLGNGDFRLIDNWLLLCPDVDTLRFVEDRQLTHAKGSALQRPADLLDLEPYEAAEKIIQGLFPLLLAHRITLDWPGLACLEQEVKEWLFYAFGIYHSVNRQDSRQFAQNYSNTDVLHRLLQLGVSPSTTVYGQTMLQHIILSCGSMQLSQLNHVHHWIRTLHSLGVDLAEYGRHEHKVFSKNVLRSQALYVPEHRLIIESFTHGPTSADWHFTLTASHRTRYWRKRTLPGHWPQEDLNPSIIFWRPGVNEYDQWEMGSAVKRPSLTMDETALRSHLGYAADELVEPIQDDHGILYRSFMRKVDSRSRPYRRRASSQPRSLKGMVWRTAPTRARPWLGRIHLCPFQSRRMLHATSYDGLNGCEFQACVQGRFRRKVPWYFEKS